MMKAYVEQLTYIQHVSRNKSEKCINSLIETVAGSMSSSADSKLLFNFFDTTLSAFKEVKNERLWFKTCLRLGKLMFDQGDYAKVESIISQLYDACMIAPAGGSGGSTAGSGTMPDPKKGQPANGNICA